MRALNRRNHWKWAVVVLAVVCAVLVAAAVDQQSQGRADGARLPAGRALNGDIDATTFRRIAEAQTPTVVSIRTEAVRERRRMDSFEQDFFERFFGWPRRPDGPAPSPDPDEQILEGAGSGFIIDPGGLILTNNHVVEGATRIDVGLFAQVPGAGGGNRRLLEAKIVGRDPLTDTALIRLVDKPSEPLPVAKLGVSEMMAPGDWVVAIGNPFSLAHTVTVGVISAKGRPFVNIPGRQQRMLQTDAAINPGNSGGPLLNVRGEVIGISSAIYGRFGNLGIGFAVPIDVVKELLPQLREGKVTRGRIGVAVTPVPPGGAGALGLDEARGAVVSTVEPDGPAAAAGLRPGDVIVEFGGKPVSNTEELVDMVVNTAPGTTVPVRVIRDGKPVTLRVRVEELNLGATRSEAARDELTESFGLQLRDQPAGRRGADTPAGPVVAGVEPRGPAARAGIAPGDVILEVNRERVRTAAEAAAQFRQTAAGGVALVLLSRTGQNVFVTVPRESR